MIHHTVNSSSLSVLWCIILLLYHYKICICLFDFCLFILFHFVYSIYLFSFQDITRTNSSRAVGDILVFTFVNLRDNTVYTENTKYIVLVKKQTVIRLQFIKETQISTENTKLSELYYFGERHLNTGAS